MLMSYIEIVSEKTLPEKGNIQGSETMNVGELENTCTAERICRTIRLGTTDYCVDSDSKSKIGSKVDRFRGRLKEALKSIDH